LKAQSIFIFILFVGFSCSPAKETKTRSVQKSSKTEKLDYLFEFENESTLSPVLDKAKSLGKLVYLDISAEWCVPCQLMKRDVYTHAETADYFKTNFVNYLVDVQKNEGPDLKIIYNVHSFPTLLILDEKGRVISRHEGAYYHRDLINFGQSALDLKK
jgi:thioredoxin-related protein